MRNYFSQSEQALSETAVYMALCSPTHNFIKYPYMYRFGIFYSSYTKTYITIDRFYKVISILPNLYFPKVLY